MNVMNISNSDLHQSILNTTDTAMLLVDRNLDIRWLNSKAAAFSGLAEKRLTGHSVRELFQFFSFPTNHIVETIAYQQSFRDSEVTVGFPDGRHAIVEVNCTPLKIELEIYALIEIHTLDQQRKISQESQQISQHMAARELVRGLAHEIKNPLGGIRGAAQLMERSLPNDELNEYTSLIIEQCDRLQQLVDRLLGPNKMPKREWCNIHEIIESTRQLCSYESPDGITIDRDYDPSIPAVFIDKGLVQQALLNITRNAIQALTQGGHITLKTRVNFSPPNMDKQTSRAIAIQIIDNGPGIPDHLKDTLFYPMVSGKKTGSGLGLSIAQMLILQHEGRIECLSRPGHTEFTIYLPMTEKPCHEQ